MGTTILGMGECAVLQPLWGRGKCLRLWAKNGLVCWESAGEFGTMRWQEAARRVVALSEMILKPVDGGYASEREQIQAFICKMEPVIRKAKEQGGPDDLEAAAAQGRRRRRSAIVPQLVDMEIT